MKKWLLPVAMLTLLLPSGLGQTQPDLGPVFGPVDEAAGLVVPPATDVVYGVAGEDLKQEDIRLFLDMNVTKGMVSPLGFLVGSGNIELQADIHIRGELRVISTERIRKAIEGENAYNISAENASWMSELYIPAEVFRVTFTAQAITLFQDEMELALRKLVADTVPELDILALDITWENASPLDAFTDFSLTEPPIAINLDATVQYLRVESLGSLLNAYLASSDKPKPGEDEIKNSKAEAGDALRTREFFSAAAYDQLLNLSLQPGWSLDAKLAVPQGYSFEYVNDEVSRPSSREIAFTVDGDIATEEDPKVLIASITHRRAVSGVMLLALVGSILLVNAPLVWVHHRIRHQPANRQLKKTRLAKHKARTDAASDSVVT